MSRIPLTTAMTGPVRIDPPDQDESTWEYPYEDDEEDEDEDE